MAGVRIEAVSWTFAWAGAGAGQGQGQGSGLRLGPALELFFGVGLELRLRRALVWTGNSAWVLASAMTQAWTWYFSKSSAQTKTCFGMSLA